jgi:hypothetical protein
MKRILLVISFLSLIFAKSFAQSSEYLKAMEEAVSAVQAAQFGTDLTPNANLFERIAAAEPKEWLPNYWSAYCLMMNSYVEQNPDKKDILLEKAERLIATAEKLKPNNDEIEVLKANIASARMAVSPQDRWQQYGAISSNALQNAYKINPENPRAKLLEAQGIFYTPEAYGGGKDKAKPLLQEAIEKFAKFKPVSSISPNWGEVIAKWTLSQI